MLCTQRAVPCPPGSAAPLCQIRQGFSARWQDLCFSVESDSQQWTAQVEHSSGTKLYTAHRSSATAARLAAMEFAIFRVLGAASTETPQRLSQRMKWAAYW
jgi:hypothetical protein